MENGKPRSQNLKLMCIWYEFPTSFLVIIDDIAGKLMILTTLYGILQCYTYFMELDIFYTPI